MKKRISILVILVTIFSCMAHAQKTKIKVSASMQTHEEQQEPAQLQITIPEDEDSNLLLNAAISAVLKPLSKGPFTSKIVAEFHRNTLIDEKQYNYQAGYQFSLMSGDGSKLTPYITGNLKYIRDKVEDDHSFAASINALGYLDSEKGLSLGKPTYFNEEKNTFTFLPSLEVQYQGFYVSEDDPGSILRPLLNFSASLAFNRKKSIGAAAPQKAIEFATNFVSRCAIINSTTSGEKWTKLFKGGINYYIYFGDAKKQSPVSLGASYNLGSDPLNGLKDQTFWQFALQIKI